MDSGEESELPAAENGSYGTSLDSVEGQKKRSYISG
jgi:hypothetical protein